MGPGQTGMGIIDFTNPKATKWHLGSLQGLFEKGIDAIKKDFGERIPSLDVQWHYSELEPKDNAQLICLLYNKVVYKALKARFGENEAVLFDGTATAGTQRFPLQVDGDYEFTPEAMADSVRAGLSLGLSNYTFWYLDIGGLKADPKPGSTNAGWHKDFFALTADCMVATLSEFYGQLTTVTRLNRGISRILGKWTALKARLMPYIFAEVQQAVKNALPLILRATCLEHPDHPASWYLDRQYILGESLLIAPVSDQSGEVEFNIPKGRWMNFFRTGT